MPPELHLSSLNCRRIVGQHQLCGPATSVNKRRHQGLRALGDSLRKRKRLQQELAASLRQASGSDRADWSGRREREGSLEDARSIKWAFIKEAGNLMVSQKRVQAALHFNAIRVGEEKRDLGILSRRICESNPCLHGFGRIRSQSHIRIQASVTNASG